MEAVMPDIAVTLYPQDCDAVLFDLDGVLTSTAKADASTIALVQQLRALSIKTAVTTCSTHCREALETAGISQLFDAHIDGADIVFAFEVLLP